MVHAMECLGKGLSWPESIRTAVEHLRQRHGWKGRGIAAWSRSLKEVTGVYVSTASALRWIGHGQAVGMTVFKEALKKYFGWGPHELTPKGHDWCEFTAPKPRKVIARRAQWDEAFRVYFFRAAHQAGLALYDRDYWKAFAYAVLKTRDGGIMRPGLARRWKAGYARGLRNTKHRNQSSLNLLAEQATREMLT